METIRSQQVSHAQGRGKNVPARSAAGARWAVLATAAFWVVAGSLTIGPLAGGAEPTEWLVGGALGDKLAQKENAFWQDAPLRKTLEKFCRAHRIALLIDRRVDPGQRLDGEARDVPVRDILERLTAGRNLGLAWIGPVVYVGPPDATATLRTLAELRHQDARRLPADAARKLLQSKPLAWDDFATPRKLLAELAAASGLQISGLDRVAHDLWAAADLPGLPLVDRLTLVAGQFDLTFEISSDGGRVTLVPVPEDLEQIESARRPGGATSTATRRPKTGGETRFSGRVLNKPLGEVLGYVESRFDLELKIDREALDRSGVSLDQLVSFSVKDATVDELLKAVLEPAGCVFRRQGKTIEIGPAEGQGL